MNLKKIKTIYHKEMMELFRDKKTLIMMIVVPLILYPLLFVGAMFITNTVMQSLEEGEYHVVLQEGNDLPSSYYGDSFKQMLEDTEDGLDDHIILHDTSEYSDLSKALEEEEIDAYIQVCKDLEDPGKTVFLIHYLSSVTNSNQVKSMLSDKIERYNTWLSETRLEMVGINPDYILHATDISGKDHSSTEERMGSLIGMILPFLLITMILLGAVYPAIDTTAGEKERGTLETLLTLPITNQELITGKFLAVATISLMTGILNLLSMGGILGFTMMTLQVASQDTPKVQWGSFLPALVLGLLGILAFTFFMSAIAMVVTSFAKSYKEANNYLTPLLLVVMLTGYAGMIPNIEFTKVLAAVPVLNVVLMITNLFVFKYSLSLIAEVLVTNIAYAALCIWVLSKIYRSEEMLFAESGASFQLFSKRSDLKPGGVPTITDASMVLAIVVLLMMYVGSLVQMRSVLWGLVVTQMFILLVPLLAAWYTKKDLRETFSLHIPKISQILGAVCIEAGTFPLVIIVGQALSSIWTEDLEAVNQTFAQILGKTPFWVSVLVIALLPALCEEMLFRGYFESAVSKKLKMIPALICVAVIFGLYHMSLIKFFTTGILGLALAYVLYCTKSIACTMFMHFLNNFMSVYMSYFAVSSSHLFPWAFRMPSALGILGLFVFSVVMWGIGVFCLQWSARKK
ncbi:MAG: ABC transporter permease subunit [Lachnospiraceae bacterium]|nr:ABC transporter permease subunit [Lachnospiraceae bacterium]